MAVFPLAPIRALSPWLAGALLALAAGSGVRPAAAAPVDYSGNALAPSQVSIDAFGKYLFEGQVGNTSLSPSQVDFITINVPQGLAISSINLDYYDSTDDRAFIGFQAGNQFTANQATGAGMLAYNHFGWRGLCATTYGALRPASFSANYNCTNGTDTNPLTTPTSTNLFTNLHIGSPRLAGPLPAGDYTFWIQQISGDSGYRFTVSTINVPGPLPLLGAAGAFGWSRRLRRRLRRGGVA